MCPEVPQAVETPEKDVFPASFQKLVDLSKSDTFSEISETELAEAIRFYAQHCTEPEIATYVLSNGKKSSLNRLLFENIASEDTGYLSKIIPEFHKFIASDDQTPILFGRRAFIEAKKKIREIANNESTSQSIRDEIIQNYLVCPTYDETNSFRLSSEILFAFQNYDLVGPTIRNFLDEKIREIELSDQKIQTFDTEIALNRFDNLIKRFLPASYARSLAYIQEHIDQDKNVAMRVLNSLIFDNELSEPETIGLLDKALQHYEVAKNFYEETFDDHCPWLTQDWFEHAVEVAKATIKAHNKVPNAEDTRIVGYSEVNAYPEMDNPWQLSKEKKQIRATCSDLLNDTSSQENITLTPTALETIQRLKKLIDTEVGKFLSLLQTDISELTSHEETPVALKQFLIQELSKYVANISEDESDFLKFLDNPDYMINHFNQKWTAHFEERMRFYNNSESTNHTSDLLNHELGRQCRSMKWALKSSSKNLEDLLDKTLAKCQNLFSFDIPLYDLLYAKFEELKQGKGRNLLEVYLGRDGVYAYVGRKATLLAKIRELGLEGRKALRENKTLYIQPKYLVYPRYFRDNMSDEVKKEYLAHEGLEDESVDPVFYDTGYTGSIPEQIMELMGFSFEEINKRIFLLTSDFSHRQLDGVDASLRSRVIQEIEHNSKSVASSVGLFKDPETGHITTIQAVASPEDQFIYAFLKKLLGIHYFYKEKTRFKADKASEKVTT